MFYTSYERNNHNRSHTLVKDPFLAMFVGDHSLHLVIEQCILGHIQEKNLTLVIFVNKHLQLVETWIAIWKHTRTGEKSYFCNICGKYFSEKYRHVRTHTGEKPYSCDICDKLFYTSNEKIQHLKCHSDEKNYSCGLCAKSFARLSSKLHHMRTHTGEKPYSCDVCGKSFTQSSAHIHTREKKIHLW